MNGKIFKSIFHPSVFIILLCGLLLTALVIYSIQQTNAVRISEAVRSTAKNTMAAAVWRIQLYEYGLAGARGVVVATGVNHLTRAIFKRYSDTRNVEVNFPGARGFGFIRRVPQNEEKQFVEKAREDGWPEFEIKELSPNFADRYVIQYVEPIVRNRPAIGLDIASEQNRREAAQDAMESGETRLSGPITLLQATGSPQQSFLILMPIYEGGNIPSTIQERLKLGLGWSYAPLLMGEVLADLPIDVRRVHLELYDISDNERGELFYNNGAVFPDTFEYVENRYVFGRLWQIRLTVSPLFIQDLNLPDTYIIAATGGFISLLMTFLFGVIRVNRVRRQEVEAQQAMITAVVESSADGIIGKDLEGNIVSWNQGAEQLLGFTKEEAIGHSVMALLMPDSLRHEELTLIEKIKNKQAVASFETRRKTKAGTELPVLVSVSPILDSLGRVVGASKSVRDISRQKKAEAHIRELNANLEKKVKQRTIELLDTNLLLNNVLDSSSEIAIIATDMNGSIKLFNSGAQRMLGYSPEEAIGKMTPLDFHLSSEVEARHKELQAETGRRVPEGLATLSYKAYKNDYDRHEWSYVAKNGQIIPVSLVITTMRDSSGDMVGILGMAMDISEQKKNQQALISARDQLLMAAEVAQLGIWTWDLQSPVLQWNDIMFDIYQYPESVKNRGVTYEDWRNRVHPEDRDNAVTALQNAIKGIDEYNLVFRIVLPDESIRYVQASAFVERDDRGKATYVAGMNCDITSERNLETWLRKAKDEADAASAAKSNFLANMSHEIRTPMNAVLGMLQLVMRTNLSNQQNDYISKAQIAAKSLLNLINDILDFSKVDAGKLELERAPFELEELLFELSTVLSGSNREKNVELIFDIDKDIPAFLIGDQMRLLQVLINLSSNALKFTLEGSVTLVVRCLSTKQGMARLSIAVKDTGIGISAEQMTHLFEAFSQAESSTARRFGGSGLGLVICRRFVELMGGELLVESKIGEGSCFHFTIDLPIADVSQQPIDNPSLRRSVRILVVDSNPASQAILIRMVHTLGWAGIKADTGQQALDLLLEAKASNQTYDIVLLDTKVTDLPGTDGAEQLRSQLAEEDCPKIILIIHSPYDRMRLNNEDALRTDYLLKPITLSQLSESVYQALSWGGMSIEADRKGATINRLLGVKILLVEDNAFNRQVADELLTMEGAIVMLATGGLEGVSMVVGQPQGTFDLVLMDMQMPDIDGLEATRRIRADKNFAALPIIAMTANVSAADRQLCLEAGMNDHLGKPLDLELMVACIRLYTANGTDDVPSVTREDRLMQEEREVTMVAEIEDIHSILDRFGGSKDLFKSVLDGFVLESKNVLEGIAHAVKQGDHTLTQEGLHTLKGACLTMGLSGLAMSLDKVEKRLKVSENQAAIVDCMASIQVAELEVHIEEALAAIVVTLEKVSE